MAKSVADKAKKCRVILDTSVLLMVYEGVDVIEEIENSLGIKCEFLIPSAVISELVRLRNQKTGWKGRASAVALQYIEGKASEYKVPLSMNYRTADDAIVDIAKNFRDKFIYATVDKELKQRLRGLNVPILTWWFGKRKFTIVA